MNLVTTEWLEKNLDSVKVFDATWHMPSSKRKAKKEFRWKIKYKKNKIFKDILNENN